MWNISWRIIFQLKKYIQDIYAGIYMSKDRLDGA